MPDYQKQKTVVRDYFSDIETASCEQLNDVLGSHCAACYQWRGSYPWRELQSQQAVVEKFWRPLKQSLTAMQRREDIFMAGKNLYDDDVWVMSMGNFMGLFDQDFCGIPATRKIVNLRYAEFNCVRDGKIAQSGIFVDLIGLMDQAGVYPLPPSTGHYYNYPGPRTHDGLMYDTQAPEHGEKTMEILNRMIDDLSDLNKSGSMRCPPEVLAKTWHDDMLWYGPAGVGATYTIERYQQQHQLPFRAQLSDKAFEGHVCRIAEGDYACFFGWPNLSNTPIGGWLGLPGGQVNTKMQVVDVYRRAGDKLAENWVLIDLPYWLSQQGLDVLTRTAAIFNPKSR